MAIIYNSLSRVAGPNTAEAWGYLGLHPAQLPTGDSVGFHRNVIDLRNSYVTLSHELQGQSNVMGYIPGISTYVGMVRCVHALALLILSAYLQDSSTRDLAAGQFVRGLVEYSGFSYAINANADMAMTAFNLAKRVVASTPIPLTWIASYFK